MRGSSVFIFREAKEAVCVCVCKFLTVEIILVGAHSNGDCASVNCEDECLLSLEGGRERSGGILGNFLMVFIVKTYYIHASRHQPAILLLDIHRT